MSYHLNPSSAHRWVNCTGSVAMAYRYPRPETEDRTYAEEGIRAHVVAENILLNRPYDDSDSDMVEGGLLYADTIKSMVSDVKKCIVEGYVGAPTIHKELGGTPDCYAFDKDNNTIHIFDYKYGFKYVDVFENWQLLSYAAAVLANTNHADDVMINMVVVQPRSYCKEGPVRIWSMYKHNLLPYFARLKEAADATQTPNAPCVSGSHCYKCPAAHACVTLQQSAYSACDLTSDGEYVLDDQTIGAEYSMLLEAQDRLKSRISGIEIDLEYRLKTGRSVPGFTLESTVGREGWNIPDNQVIDTADMLGIDVSKIGVITPAQARKKGLNAEVVASMSERKPGAIKIVKTRKLFG